VFPPDEAEPERPRKIFEKPSQENTVVKTTSGSKAVMRHTRTQTQCLDIGASVFVQVEDQEVKPSVTSGSQTEARRESNIMVVEIERVDSNYNDTDSVVVMEESLNAADSINAADSSAEEEESTTIVPEEISPTSPESTVTLIDFIDGIVESIISSSVKDLQSQHSIETQAGGGGFIDASVQQDLIQLETQSSQTFSAVKVHASAQHSIDVSQTTDSQTQSDPISTSALETVFDNIATECSSLADENTRLRGLLSMEKKKRQNIAEENAILRYRYERLSRVAYSALVGGLERQLELETALYEDSL
jgi:DNA-binding NarL/FixJ family response regulator